MKKIVNSLVLTSLFWRKESCSLYSAKPPSVNGYVAASPAAVGGNKGKFLLSMASCASVDVLTTHSLLLPEFQKMLPALFATRRSNCILLHHLPSRQHRSVRRWFQYLNSPLPAKTFEWQVVLAATCKLQGETLIIFSTERFSVKLYKIAMHVCPFGSLCMAVYMTRICSYCTIHVQYETYCYCVLSNCVCSLITKDQILLGATQMYNICMTHFLVAF